MQDVEFRIGQGKVWIFNARNAMRSPRAAVKIAVDMIEEGRISREEALRRVRSEQVAALFNARFDPVAKRKAHAQGAHLANGINASPGARRGTG